LYQFLNDGVWAVFQAEVCDDIFDELWLLKVLIVVDNVVLEDLARQLPVRKPACHDERLQLFQEDLLQLLLLEEQEEIVK
jgi:hypothetical protein